jgi:hypothetical protein
VKVNHLDNIHEAAGRVLLEQLLDRFLETPAPVNNDFLVAILPVYDHDGRVVALDVCSLANGEEYQVGDERFIAAATFIKDQAADRRGAAIVRGFAPVHVLAPTAFNSGRVSEESSAMHDKQDKHHDKHAEKRAAHKAASIAAMAQQTTVEGRAEAFLKQQHAFLSSSLHELRTAGLPDSVGAELQHELDVYATEHGEIAHAIAHGIKA